MNSVTRPPSRWLQLQTELRDLAFVLDRRGSPAAAELAITVAARIGELVAEDMAPREAVIQEPVVP